jgi:pyruvate/2-oxoglutarate dehydrogenase complex dihydrolipoamide acyltransferase (E2) component
MNIEIYLPRLGSTTMDAAEVREWLVSVGDEVSEGQPLVVVETDKVDVDVPSPASGTVAEIVAGPGVEVPVGGTLGFITPPSGG